MLSSSSSSPLPFHVVLAGPTACGKSSIALEIAKQVPTEIISMDSALVYRGMNIGTAKPTARELALVPHHLIDIRDPMQAYSAMEFVRDAKALIHAVAQRGRLPLLVGGTMLYLKALIDGLDDMPAASASVRTELEAQAAHIGWPAMHAQLAAIDPTTAARLAPADRQRIQRALEVFRITGRPISAFHAQGAKRQGPTTEPVDNNRYLLLSLEPSDRKWLHARIEARFGLMLESGLLDEVGGLRERADLHRELPAMRCVGYRQVWEALDGMWPAKELPLRAIAATRQLAKRQITWLRSMPQRIVVNAQSADAQDQVLQCIQRAWP